MIIRTEELMLFVKGAVYESSTKTKIDCKHLNQVITVGGV